MSNTAGTPGQPEFIQYLDTEERAEHERLMANAPSPEQERERQERLKPANDVPHPDASARAVRDRLDREGVVVLREDEQARGYATPNGNALSFTGEWTSDDEADDDAGWTPTSSERERIAQHAADVRAYRRDNAVRDARRQARRRGTPRRARSREHRSTTNRRPSSSSSTSSADPGSDSDEPEPEPRLCACGCGRSIAHKRAGARTYDPSCRKRLSREAEPPTAIDAEPAQRPHRASSAGGEDVDTFAFFRWLMESNGDHTSRHRARVGVVA